MPAGHKYCNCKSITGCPWAGNRAHDIITLSGHEGASEMGWRDGFESETPARPSVIIDELIARERGKGSLLLALLPCSPTWLAAGGKGENYR